MAPARQVIPDRVSGKLRTVTHPACKPNTSFQRRSETANIREIFDNKRAHGKRFEVTMDSFQDTIFKLKHYWADRGAIIQEPHDLEVGAGTMAPGNLSPRAWPKAL